MIKTTIATIVIGAVLSVSGCTRADPVSPLSNDGPRFLQSPADGNGNKLVIPIDAQFPGFPTCANGATLSLHAVGWVQVHGFGQPTNRNLELDGLLVVFTYSNAAGETFVWREVGPDHFYIDQNGDLIHSISGHDGFDGVIGRFVINATTGEVTFLVGNKIGTRDEQACAALGNAAMSAKADSD